MRIKDKGSMAIARVLLLTCKDSRSPGKENWTDESEKMGADPSARSLGI
jgi:hypothetical protein